MRGGKKDWGRWFIVACSGWGMVVSSCSRSEPGDPQRPAETPAIAAAKPADLVGEWVLQSLRCDGLPQPNGARQRASFTFQEPASAMGSSLVTAALKGGSCNILTMQSFRFPSAGVMEITEGSRSCNPAGCHADLCTGVGASAGTTLAWSYSVRGSELTLTRVSQGDREACAPGQKTVYLFSQTKPALGSARGNRAPLSR